MKSLENKVNINPADSDFPFGDVRDKTTGIAGTKWNREMMSDYIQFFHKIFAESGLTYNEQLDNEYSGWQLYDAFRKIAKPYVNYVCSASQAGTNAPSVTVLGLNDLGAIVWTYNGVGSYYGTLVGAFPDGFLQFIGNGGIAGLSEIDLRRISDDVIEIRTYAGGSPSNGVLDNVIEIRRLDA